MKIAKSLLLLAVLSFALNIGATGKHTFEVKDGNFVYDSKPIRIISGEMNYSRIPKEYWRHRLKMAKAMGLNAVATYVSGIIIIQHPEYGILKQRTEILPLI